MKKHLFTSKQLFKYFTFISYIQHYCDQLHKNIVNIKVARYKLITNNLNKFKFLGYVPDPNNVCLKTGWFSALLALGGGAMCILGGALLATCNRLRKQTIDKVLTVSAFDGYMSHKGRIN